MKYGTIWARVGGGIIDFILVLIITSVVLFIWGLFRGLTNHSSNLDAETEQLAWQARGFLAGLLVDLIYTISMQASAKCSTYGQRASDLIIIKTDGSKVGIGRLLWRYFISLFSSIALKLGFLIAIFTKKNQTLHDLVADTVVVEKDSHFFETYPPIENQSNINSSGISYSNSGETAFQKLLNELGAPHWLEPLLVILSLCLMIYLLLNFTSFFY